MYNQTVLSLFSTPTRQGSYPLPDARGCAGREGAGPFLIIELLGSKERIYEAQFCTYGCPAAIACGEFVCRWIAGRTSEDVEKLTTNDLLTVLGGLPLGKEHCAQLAVDALKDAVNQFITA